MPAPEAGERRAPYRRGMTPHLQPVAPPDPQLALETRALTKRFGARTAVDAVDLRVPRGVAFGYLGPNGAGKTTLIRMLLGLTRASSGTMSVLGQPVPERRVEALARVGAIVEEPRFHGHLSGRENLALLAAVRRDGAAARIDAALERVGLTARAGDRVRTYSLGMRQRLGIARCLLADPDLLILDEPMNGLDPAGILEFRGFVRSFVAEGRTIVLSSHLLDEVEKTCDAVAIVDRGRIVVQGSIDSLAAGVAPSVLVETRDRAGTTALLRAHPAVLDLADEGASLRATLADAATVPELARALVAAGQELLRLEPARPSLEERFLAVTTRLENAA